MAEIRKENKISYQCDICNKGEMIANGKPRHIDSDQIPHKCNICGCQNVFSTHYPVTRR